ncbi:predicted protein [Aspergillus nidulans FGSC A4]|uniref:Uncharacterized protein n=1 Tax=Emericella nidulans (strain FGSC A4 / ATCC 38163 / CBS 112.46 / NRRL 194 / M139) TaxID=227321 RepID=Q5B892_EMENI|nr:hypothetical protein [Aspergillus nidulans FGSC A4]EAA63139.1 predicted protein [Aspergillus nidulans FGSC A4]CBF83122.1 TPA: conserved hypothetical protein [Aspergillus nidulans FGSC A4]|eukprot:XP_660842.1 predicted protein [Aspergillus nidulans FGSC A4]
MIQPISWQLSVNMLFSSVLVAIALACLSTLCHQTMDRFLPINGDLLPHIGQRRASDDAQNREISSRPTNPALSMTERTAFNTQAYTVYGYSSPGGVQINESDLLDMVSCRSRALMHCSVHPVPMKKTIFVMSCCGLARRSGKDMIGSRLADC